MVAYSTDGGTSEAEIDVTKVTNVSPSNTLAAQTLIGKTVEAVTDEGTSISGKVISTTLINNETKLVVTYKKDGTDTNAIIGLGQVKKTVS
jgi:hypothetical protein